MPDPTVSKPSSKGNPRTFPLTVQSALREFNTRFCYVHSGSVIAELSPNRIRDYRIPLISPAVFQNEAYSNIRIEGVPIAKEWFRWSERSTVSSLIYEPGQPRFVDSNLNTWFPSPNLPISGDHSLFLHYLTELFSSDPTYLPWFLRWIAYPLQHPGSKLNTAILLWSSAQGNGKSTLGYILRQIYGLHNSAEIKEGDIGGQFNSWAAQKQLIIIDEMHGRNASKKGDEIKSMITRQTATVRELYRASYEVRDTLNYFFTSNHYDAFSLSSSDRRFFVQHIGPHSLTQQWFVTVFHPWLKLPGSISAIHDYLLNIDLTLPVLGGDPFSPNPAPFSKAASAPQTSSRSDMVYSSLDDIQAWLTDSLPAQTLYSSDDLYSLYSAQNPSYRDGRHGIAKRAKSILFTVGGGNPVLLADGSRKRLFSTTSTHQALDHAQLRDVHAQEWG